MQVKGYKATNLNMTCRGFQFEIGKKYKIESGIVIQCFNGFHFCEEMKHVMNYYGTTCRLFEVIGSGHVMTIKDSEQYNDKSVCSEIEFVKEVDYHELYKSNNSSLRKVAILNLIRLGHFDVNSKPNGHYSFGLTRYEAAELGYVKVNGKFILASTLSNEELIHHGDSLFAELFNSNTITERLVEIYNNHNMKDHMLLSTVLIRNGYKLNNYSNMIKMAEVLLNNNFITPDEAFELYVNNYKNKKNNYGDVLYVIIMLLTLTDKFDDYAVSFLNDDCIKNGNHYFYNQLYNLLVIKNKIDIGQLHPINAKISSIKCVVDYAIEHASERVLSKIMYESEIKAHTLKLINKNKLLNKMITVNSNFDYIHTVGDSTIYSEKYINYVTMYVFGLVDDDCSSIHGEEFKSLVDHLKANKHKLTEKEVYTIIESYIYINQVDKDTRNEFYQFIINQL